MSGLLVAAGAALLIYCFIWAYTWFEVWRDPKDELKDFYSRHPRTEKLVLLANKLWLPAFAIGVLFIVIGSFTGEM